MCYFILWKRPFSIVGSSVHGLFVPFELIERNYDILLNIFASIFNLALMDGKILFEFHKSRMGETTFSRTLPASYQSLQFAS